MKKLLEFIIEEITGTKDFSIEEKEEEGNVTLIINGDPSHMGLIIGKNGVTIKAIQTVLRVRARLEGKMVFVVVSSNDSTRDMKTT